VNQPLDAGDAIRTLAQSRSVILLADETQVKLNAGTTLELRSVRQTSSLVSRVVQASMAQGDASLLNLAAARSGCGPSCGLRTCGSTPPPSPPPFAARNSI